MHELDKAAYLGGNPVFYKGSEGMGVHLLWS